MKWLVKRIALPLLLLVGLTLYAPQSAEAAKWRRYARRYGHRPYHVAPAAVYAPPVRVNAPGVRVRVGPGVHVRAPGVRVNVGSWYPTHYGRPYYSRW
ncbi:MAG: hypothetical protein ACYTG0_27880 [Planctomycetota bacterium]|jgi:hypothetical protein